MQQEYRDSSKKTSMVAHEGVDLQHQLYNFLKLQVVYSTSLGIMTSVTFLHIIGMLNIIYTLFKYIRIITLSIKTDVLSQIFCLEICGLWDNIFFVK